MISIAAAVRPAKSCLIGLMLCLWATAVHAAPQPIGETTKIVETVEGTVEAVSRVLVERDQVHWLELIETQSDSAAKIVFADESKLSIGPNAQITLDSFVYAGGDEDASIVTMTRGVLRYVSGKMRREGVEIKTPSATIGIRGTNFAVLVDGEGRTYLVMDQAGATTITSICAGVQGPALDTCRQPLDVDLGQVAEVMPGDRARLNDALTVALGENDTAGDGAVPPVLALIKEMDRLLENSADEQPHYRPNLPDMILPPSLPIVPIAPDVPVMPPVEPVMPPIPVEPVVPVMPDVPVRPPVTAPVPQAPPPPSPQMPPPQVPNVPPQMPRGF